MSSLVKKIRGKKEGSNFGANISHSRWARPIPFSQVTVLRFEPFDSALRTIYFSSLGHTPFYFSRSAFRPFCSTSLLGAEISTSSQIKAMRHESPSLTSTMKNSQVAPVAADMKCQEFQGFWYIQKEGGYRTSTTSRWLEIDKYFQTMFLRASSTDNCHMRWWHLTRVWKISDDILGLSHQLGSHGQNMFSLMSWWWLLW